MKVTTAPKVYAVIGRCIYCGIVNDELRREHIIPFGLAGNLILPKASCRACEAVTGKIEHSILRGILGNFRIRHGFSTRRKKERSAELVTELIGVGGQITTQSVPIKEYPRSLLLFRQKPPGILVGRAASNVFDPDICLIAHSGDDEKLFGNSARWGTYRNSDFCLMLAKIAHSYAVADVGLETLSGYDLPLPKLILQRVDATDYYIGGQPKADPPAENGVLHKLQTVTGEFNNREFLMVNIRLFAHFGAPLYQVVVGERPISSSADAASNSSARRRVAGGLRLRLGIGDEIPSLLC